MFRDADQTRQLWLGALVSSLAKRIHTRVKGRDAEEFSILLVSLLQDILYAYVKDPAGNYGGRYWSILEAGSRLLLSKKTIVRHLKAAARAGILKAVSAYDRETNQRLRIEIVVSPELLEAYGKKDLATARGMGDAYGEVWLSRYDWAEDVQGFNSVTRWGRFDEGFVPKGDMRTSENGTIAPVKPLPQPGTINPLRAKILAAAEGGNITRKALDEAEKKRRKAVVEKFIEGAAVIWLRNQNLQGRNPEPPAWAGPRNLIPLGQRQERVELEKVFATYGGKKAALAWCVFTTGKPKGEDEKTFDPSLGYAHWTTPDKRPGQFVKHLNACLEYANYPYWSGDEKLLGRLADIFGEAFREPAAQGFTVDRFTAKKPSSTTPKQDNVNGNKTSSAGASSGGNSNVDLQAPAKGDAGGWQEGWPTTPDNPVPELQQH